MVYTLQIIRLVKDFVEKIANKSPKSGLSVVTVFKNLLPEPRGPVYLVDQYLTLVTQSQFKRPEIKLGLVLV